jgi:uncharacterized phage protein gp47/JayE
VAELTSTGLTIRTQAEIQADLETEERANISDRLDVSTSSPFGQHNAISARALRILEEALAAIYLAMDPDSATGDALDRVAAITGSTREAATFTRSATVTVNVDAGTYAIGTLVAQVDGQPTSLFANAEAVVNAGPGAANVAVAFDATTTGPLACPLDTLVISGAVSGWNSVVDNTEGVPGSTIESDEAFRLRRESEVSNPGSASVNGIRADVLREVASVDTISIIENDTDATVDTVPPHSIECVVFGPTSPTAQDDQDVADQIFASKSAGIGTAGTTSKTVTDTEGQDHTISFTRPTTVNLALVVTLEYEASTYAGDQTVKDKIVAESLLNYVPGLDGSGSKIASWVHEVAGVLRVTAITINAGSSFGTYALNSRQVGETEDASISVVSSAATP